MTKYRFIGDPAERAEGKVITPGPWLDLPSDLEFARKIMGNAHYEIEGVPVLERAPKPKPKPRARAAPRPDPALSEHSDGWE